MQTRGSQQSDKLFSLTALPDRRYVALDAQHHGRLHEQQRLRLLVFGNLITSSLKVNRVSEVILTLLSSLLGLLVVRLQLLRHSNAASRIKLL